MRDVSSFSKGWMTAMTTLTDVAGQIRSLVGCLALALAALLPFAASAATANAILMLPAGATMPEQLPVQLAAWRQSGEVSDVLWLDSDQRDGAGFATLVALEFPTEGYYEAWRRNRAAQLAAPLVVRRVDVLAHGEITPRDSNKSVFKVNIYHPTVSAKEYADYATGYIKPLMEGQRAAKVLIRYTIYQERGAAVPAASYLVMEYRDSLAFGKAEGIKTELRARLKADDPAYARYDGIKDRLRTAGPETLARYQELPPPSLPGLPAYVPEFKVVGGFRIVGSELKNAVEQLAEGFNKFHPAAKMTVSHIPSSEGGIAGLYFNVSDIAPMGDDAKITDMMPFYNTFGYMPTEISVATGGYEKRGSLFAWAIVVHPDNPLDEISVDELEQVFGSERTGGWALVDGDYKFTSKFARGRESNIRTWGQLGLKGEYARREIDTFGYSAPGFATYFERNWFHWSKKWNGNFREYVEAKQTSPDEFGAAVASTVPLEDLRTNKYAIGIAGLMHVKDYPDLKVLRISTKKGGAAVALTPDNVASRRYPLIRDAYFYVNKPPGRALDPKVREFMRFVLSREGQEIIARVGYYYPLDAEYLAEQRAKLD
jgi:phosphate transport system substrate-binding protein